MAVAVKNTPETTGHGLFDRLPVVSLIGALYVLGSLGVVFYLIPSIWRFGESFISIALLLVTMLAAGAGLIFLGTRLVGPNPPHGVRAGIFTALVGLAVVGFIAWLVGTILENLMLGMDASTRTVLGGGLTVLVGVGLLAFLVRMFFRPGFEAGVVAFEDQGWFTATAYKRSQGQKVRRGTILGLLFLTGSGIYTMLAHKSLEGEAYKNWELTIPFTQELVQSPGDTGLPKGGQVDRSAFNRANEELKDKVKVTATGGVPDAPENDPTRPRLQEGQVVNKTEFKEEHDRLYETEKVKPPTSVSPAPATGTRPSIVLLPNVKYTLPMLLALASLWLSYRVVNYPVFADFLIATEAELNKVSWTTRKRLVQDTIVVLVTVVLLTVFLLVVDVFWSQLLRWKYIGVLRGSDPTQQTGDVPDSAPQKPW